MFASICLAVWPQNLTNEYGDDAGVVNAADEWQMVYLTADATANVAKLRALTKNDKRVKIVMQADFSWNNGGKYDFGFNDTEYNDLSWILDLNGYTLNQNIDVTWYVEQFEITDSSVAGTGCINSNKNFAQYKQNGAHLIVSGGTINCARFTVGSYTHHNRRMTISGGIIKAKQIGFWPWHDASSTPKNGDGYFVMQGGLVVMDELVYPNTVLHTEIVDYVTVVKDAAGNIICLTTDNFLAQVARWNNHYKDYYYALSKTPDTSGAYNYAYGVLWEVTAEQLADLNLAETYYLWYRPIPTDANPNPGWYTYTGLTTTVA